MLKGVLGPYSIIRVQTWDSEALAPSSITEILGGTWPQEVGAVASGGADFNQHSNAWWRADNFLSWLEDPALGERARSNCDSN